MIGLIILGLASFSVLSSGAAQEYRQARPSRTYSSSDDEEVAYEKPAPTPVPILKQINSRNDDGSYTYGFEAADGTFKIETKEANGQVRGKYGYPDASGKLHVVEYGANKFGFQPSGEGITVPPVNFNPEPEPEEEEEEPRYVQAKQAPRPRPKSQIQSWLQQAPAPAPVPQRAQIPAAAPAPAPRPQSAQPHIVYSSAVPKKQGFNSLQPSFFAGAQPAASRQAETYDYDEPAPQPRPAPRPQAPAPRPQPIQYSQPKPQAVKYAPTERTVANFIPSPIYRQATQFSQPSASRQVEYDEEPQQYYSPEPARPQQSRFTQTEAILSEEPRSSYAPKAPKARTGGFLDQLQEQYSLPKSGNAQSLHDVSFGFY